MAGEHKFQRIWLLLLIGFDEDVRSAADELSFGGLGSFVRSFVVCHAPWMQHRLALCAESSHASKRLLYLLTYSYFSLYCSLDQIPFRLCLSSTLFAVKMDTPSYLRYSRTVHVLVCSRLQFAALFLFPRTSIHPRL